MLLARPKAKRTTKRKMFGKAFDYIGWLGWLQGLRP
jgi:hypothetical protein